MATSNSGSDPNKPLDVKHPFPRTRLLDGYIPGRDPIVPLPGKVNYGVFMQQFLAQQAKEEEAARRKAAHDAEEARQLSARINAAKKRLRDKRTDSDREVLDGIIVSGSIPSLNMGVLHALKYVFGHNYTSLIDHSPGMLAALLIADVVALRMIWGRPFRAVQNSWEARQEYRSLVRRRKG